MRRGRRLVGLQTIQAGGEPAPGRVSMISVMAQQSRAARSEWKLWAAVVVVLAAFAVAQQWLNRTPTDYQRVKLDQPIPGTEKSARQEIKEASMTPGRVVELDTSRGRIEFLLFEKDCPITTSHIADLIRGGRYSGVKFDRVEKDKLIQTALCKKQVAPIRRELLKGLVNAKGAVGMARLQHPDSATSSFYILLEPWPHLDLEFTVFGRLIRGMDVAFKIKKGDSIKSARVRDLTPDDRKLFERKLRIEAERKTE